MTKSTGKRRHHFKHTTPRDPALTPLAAWPVPNRNFHKAFYRWLKEGGYGETALNTYTVAARLALGYLDKLYWQIDPEKDLALVRAFLQTSPRSASTCREYNKGLRKLAEYLTLRQNRPSRIRPVNWAYHLAGMPPWLAEDVQSFVAHRQKGWRPEDRHRNTLETLGHICPILRWMAGNVALEAIGDITPAVWFDFLEARLAQGIQPTTLNSQLFRLKAFLHFLDEAGQPVCPRTLLLEPLKTGPRLPKDVPVAHLRGLLSEIEREAAADHALKHRMGTLDRAWVHLMLFSGLRTGEVRRMRLKDIAWEANRIRIEQSKGLKDRLVYMNPATETALKTWLAMRGSAAYLGEHVFLYRHKPLSSRYCQTRLRTYGQRTGLSITPHQLRHSCATLLLNAGAPVVTVQTLLGHEKLDTTLGYARLYDGTIAADYYRAMGMVERQLALEGDVLIAPPKPGELLALVDAIGDGTLNSMQRENLQVLREGILTFAKKGN